MNIPKLQLKHKINLAIDCVNFRYDLERSSDLTHEKTHREHLRNNHAVRKHCTHPGNTLSSPRTINLHSHHLKYNKKSKDHPTHLYSRLTLVVHVITVILSLFLSLASLTFEGGCARALSLVTLLRRAKNHRPRGRSPACPIHYVVRKKVCQFIDTCYTLAAARLCTRIRTYIYTYTRVKRRRQRLLPRTFFRGRRDVDDRNFGEGNYA